MSLVMSVVTCGFWLPVWLFQTLRKPQVETLFIDEYGNQHWEDKKISTAQRVWTVIVIFLILYWIVQLSDFINGINDHHPQHQWRH
ncbi:hypothetical protein [Mycobacterium bourgelatii]|uniref:hypothetical protein n=1 Tax=Mycobacterium bourgelatii TaxID=1273442 RepID=UPI0013D019C3|nr:hypothetical protein [Mycobacterium bourgelatii]